MNRIWARLAIAVAATLAATPAMALQDDSWVSASGSDANACSRSLPCRTLQVAHDNTLSGGSVTVIDPGRYGPLTITKAISIRSLSGQGLIVRAGIVINAPSDAKVVIDGLDIDAQDSSVVVGISIISARDVLLRNMIIKNYDSVGVRINGSTQISVTVEHSTFWNNGVGILVDSSGGNGAARVFDSLIAVSTTAGIRVSGAGNRAEIARNEIVRTPQALSILNGGAIYSYGGNVGTPGGAPTAVPTF